MEAKVEPKKQVKQKEEIVSPGKVIWRRLKRNRLAMAGLYILVIMFLFSFIGPLFSSWTMDTTDLVNVNVGPSSEHLLGTDELGRDMLTRLMYGGRISLTVGIVAVLIETTIGSILGAISGFYGGVTDSIIMRIVDIMQCIPTLPILIMMGVVMLALDVPPEAKIYLVMLAIGILGWTGICRIVRGQILSLREQEFMQAADAVGLKDSRKIVKHLLPNTFSSILVTVTLGIGGAILTESGLSFLGLGVTIPIPSWGSLIQVANDVFVLETMPWLWMPPGLCIFLTVMAINLFGDGLRDALDPRLKR